MAEGATATKPDRRPAGRERLTRDRILEAALRFVDEHGLPALSMRKLAAELGVEAMSLYNHIDKKESILNGIADLVFAEVEIPPRDPADWRDRARQVTLHTQRALSRHSNVLPIVMSGPNRGPAFLGMMNYLVGTLRDAGFDESGAAHGWRLLAAHVLGNVLLRTATPMLAAAAGAPGRARRTDRPVPLTELPRRDFPHIVEIAPQLAEFEAVDEFDFGLDVILTGLQAKLEAAQR